MPAPYHVRLAVSQYGDQFRAELFTEDLGDTEGDVLTELPPSLGEWVPYLAQGAELPPDAARQLGKDLFAALLGQPENAKKWTEVLDRARKTNRPIRLLIDATTDAVRDLPYGLLCEPHDDWFLFRGTKADRVRFVRILRRCSPRPLTLGDRPRVLVAAAEPSSADVPAFDAAGRLKALCVALQPSAEVFLVGAAGVTPLEKLAAEATTFAPFTRTTRAALKAALAGSYDVFHLLAHGHGAGILLCDAAGAPAETTAGELAEWCGAGTAGLAFLQVCKAGQTGGRGGFGGVAQQLLSPRGGNLAAVVASTFPLDAEHSTTAAAGFYRALAAGKSPEEALATHASETDWTWAFLELWARPGALGGTKQRAAFQFVSPYRGLSSFTERDADLFFGRRAEVTELLNILRTEPAVGVVGDSGSGKTSLLQAGLVYAARQGGLAGVERWRIVSLRPGYHPAQALLTALKPGSTEPPTAAALAAALRADDRPLLVIFDQFEEAFTLARDPEEARTLTKALADLVAERPDRFRLVIGMRSEFLGQSAGLPGLSRLLRRPWVLRPPGADNLRAIVVGPAEHCGYTFQGPLADGTPTHATGLLDRILADPLLAAGDGAAPSLPLLQFALERLWLKAVETGTTVFTHAAFDALGCLGTAIALHAETTYQATPTATGLGVGARAVAEHVITALVSSRGTRQPRSRAALEAETGKPDAARAVIDHLVGERLLTVRSDPADPAASLVDLAHEALVRHWDRLRGWLAEDPQGRAMRDEFRTAVEKWEAGFAGVPAKSTRGLPGADVCRNYLAWIDTHTPQLPPAALEFVAGMRGYLTRQKRTRGAVMVTLGLLAATAAALAVLADGKARDATKSAADAKESAKQAQASARDAQVRAATLALDRGIQLSEQGRPRFGLLSMAYALKACPPADACPEAAALRNVILTNLGGWATHQLCLDDVRTFPGPALATDPAGTVILCRTKGGAQLYATDAPPGQPQPLGPPIPHLPFTKDTVGMSAEVHRDGRTVLLSDGAGYSQLWDAPGGAPLGAPFITGAVGGTVLSPDRKTAASADHDGTVTLWDATFPGHPDEARKYQGKVVGSPQPHQGKVYAMEFSRDGKLLAVGCGRGAGAQKGTAGSFHLMDAATGATLRRYGLDVTVTCVAFSEDGSRVAAGGIDMFVWKTADAVNTAIDNKDLRPIGRRSGQEHTARAVFDKADAEQVLLVNPSGGLAVTHSKDRHFGAEERLSPQGWLAGYGFRPDGKVFTANVDGTVRLWGRPKRDPAQARYELPRGPEPGRKVINNILAVDFRPDGKAVAAGTRDGKVFVYHLDNRAAPTVFRCAEADTGKDWSQVAEVEFSTDGTRLIAQDESFRVFVFHVPPPGSNSDVNDPVRHAGRNLVAAAPDGRTVVVRAPHPDPDGRNYWVIDLDTGARVCRLAEPGPIGPPPELGDDGFVMRVRAVAFSPDKSRVAVAHRDGRVHVYSTATGDQVAGPIEHQIDGGRDFIRAVAYSPAGDRLLTRSPRGRGLWHAAGAPVHLLRNRVGVQLARFSRSGRLVLGGTNFNTGEVWTGDGGEAVPLPLVHASEVWGISASPDETRVVTASYDQTARVWDVATGKPISPPFAHDSGVSDAEFSPDGKTALTGSWDGTLRLWPLPTPVPDDEPRITAWVEVQSGLRVAESGIGQLLTADEWTKQRDELNRRGGPPPGIVR
ncbi:nSTAND1 domain-containing NTPase [Urbifossiella limnaea]|uniref:WD domain, G-beta repeat n=1 Tax=Urbifossiella limnaea TaxID=2528023 RepID=A0A517Y0J4_9BACT|nr:CHAT domain-containing protein [Urbifossiella limnaea]QDU23284.1 WD domain, G-beta repeat [Urbifossiella limnaea]